MLAMALGLASCKMKNEEVLKMDLGAKSGFHELLIVNDSMVIVTDHSIRGIDWRRSESIWDFDLPSMSYVLACHEEGIYVGSSSPSLIKVDSRSGELGWEVKGYFPRNGIPRFSGPRAYFPQDSRVIVLDDNTGDIEETVHLTDQQGETESFLGIDQEGDIFQFRQDSNSNGSIARFDSKTGAMVWKVDSLPFSTLALSTVSLADSSRIAFCDPSSRTFYLLDQKDGQISIQIPFAGAFDPVVVDAGELLYLDRNNRLVMLDYIKNVERWSVEMPQLLRFRPTIAEGYATVVTGASEVSVYSINDGEVTARIQLPCKSNGASLYLGGYVHVIGEDGWLYSLHAGVKE